MNSPVLVDYVYVTGKQRLIFSLLDDFDMLDLLAVLKEAALKLIPIIIQCVGRNGRNKASWVEIANSGVVVIEGIDLGST
jgi:hypothetical protein